SEIPEPVPGLCILYDRRSEVEQVLDQFSFPYNNYRSRWRLNSLEKLLGVKSFTGVIKGRCYENSD
ncbi:MAG: hypothetical protein Q7J80_09295, partial [Anaerolineales bacterium]|nr:hypothetical protein [Anaerolineales bacterium]